MFVAACLDCPVVVVNHTLDYSYTIPFTAKFNLSHALPPESANLGKCLRQSYREPFSEQILARVVRFTQNKKTLVLY